MTLVGRRAGPVTIPAMGEQTTSDTGTRYDVPTVAILGDVGGHADALADALTQLGCDPQRGSIPDGLTVIQVGDLIRKGPDSAGCVRIAETAMATSGPRWVQLLGNHEAHYLGGPQFGPAHNPNDPPPGWGIDRALVATLERWVADGQAHAAVAAHLDHYGPTLITHAGVTHHWWSLLGCERDPALAAAQLNGDLHRRPWALFRAGGDMLHGEYGHGGPLWVSAPVLLASWAQHPSPFTQIHGHTSAYRWETLTWRFGVPAALMNAAQVDTERRHLTVPVAAGLGVDHPRPEQRHIIGVDPCFGRYGGALHPFVTAGQVTDPTT